MNSNQKAAALQKQLAQLERDGEKLRDATKFIQDFLVREHGSGMMRGSKDWPTQSPQCTTFQASGLPTPVQRELHQLQAIKKKLQLTAQEISKLQDDYGLKTAHTSSPPSELATQQQQKEFDRAISAAATTSTCPLDSEQPAAGSPERSREGLTGQPHHDSKAGTIGHDDIAQSHRSKESEALLASGSPGQQVLTAGGEGQSGNAADQTTVQSPGRETTEGREGEAGDTEINGELDRLQGEIAHMRPKAAAAARLREKLATLTASAAELETLQARTTELALEAEKLPGLRQQLIQFQAAVSNVRALEARLTAEQRAHPGEGELLTRLQAQERELAARAESVSEVKARMQQLTMVALEVEGLEAQAAALSSSASRLPVLRAHHETLLASCREVECLEAHQKELEEVVSQRRRLQMQIAMLQPQAAGVEALRAQLVQLQKEAEEAAELQKSVQALSSPSGPSPKASKGPSESGAREYEGSGRLRRDLSITPSQVRSSGGLLLPGSRVPIFDDQLQGQDGGQDQEQQDQQQQRHIQHSSTFKGLAAAAESLATATPSTQDPFAAPAGPRSQQEAEPLPSRSSRTATSPSSSYSDFLTPRNSFSAASSSTSTPRQLSRSSTPIRKPSGFSPAPSLPLPPRILGRMSRRTSMTLSGQQKPLALTISVREPPPLSLSLRVEHPLPGVPDEVVKRLQQACTSAEQSEAALAELEALDEHRAVLEGRIEHLRHSPVAVEVLQLQQHLLELQHKEVAQLEVQVASLAGVGERLSYLRAERARLEALADQVCEAEIDLEEAQAVRDFRAKSRAAKREAEAMDVEVAALDIAASHLEATAAKRDACLQRLADLQAGAAEVESLKREIAGLAGTEVLLAKLHCRRDLLRVKAAAQPDLEHQLQACAAELHRLNSCTALLQSEKEALALEVASVSALEQEVESLRSQLKSLASLQDERLLLTERICAAQAQLEDNTPFAAAAQEARLLEAQVQELRSMAERKEGLQAVCDNLASLPQQVSTLQGRVEELRAALAECQRLEHLTLELEEQLLSGLGSAGGLEGARLQHQQMVAAVQEAQARKAKVAQLAPEALQLASLHDEHAGLQRDKAEASLLACDSSVLRMQASAVKKLRLWAQAEELGMGKGSRGGQDAYEESNGVVAGSKEQTEPGGDGPTEGSERKGGTAAAGLQEVEDLLELVFRRMRGLQAEQLRQQAENAELQDRVKELSGALDSSHKSVKKLKSLARAVGRIRSGFAVEEEQSSSGSEEEVSSPVNNEASGVGNQTVG